MKYARLLQDCDACLILNPANLFYFSDYDNADAIIIASPEGAFYITDSRYKEEAQEIIRDMEVVSCAAGSLFDTAKKYLPSAKRVGYEKASISYANYLNLEKLQCKLVDISRDISALRMIKSPREIEKIKQAQSITDKVFELILEHITIGISERDLASKLESLLFDCGADSLAFSSIVAAGRNTSKPHAHRTDYVLKKGDLVTLDFGAKLNGYCSDMTRTVALGNPSEKIKTMYGLVLEAQTRALANITPNISGAAADAYAREVFEQQDCDKFFTHSLGHGLGIEVHEEPRLSQKSKDILLENMVFSIEPGLYFENEFGIRIEDLAVLGENGIINLTKSTKELIIL